jgi:hypothetical protein
MTEWYIDGMARSIGGCDTEIETDRAARNRPEPPIGEKHSSDFANGFKLGIRIPFQLFGEGNI